LLNFLPLAIVRQCLSGGREEGKIFPLPSGERDRVRGKKVPSLKGLQNPPLQKGA